MSLAVWPLWREVGECPLRFGFFRKHRRDVPRVSMSGVSGNSFTK